MYLNEKGILLIQILEPEVHIIIQVWILNKSDNYKWYEEIIGAYYIIFTVN